MLQVVNENNIITHTQGMHFLSCRVRHHLTVELARVVSRRLIVDRPPMHLSGDPLSMSFKNPSFQDRIGSAADAKQKALDQLRAKAPLDEKTVAEMKARQQERESREAEKAAAKKAARQAARDAQTAVAEAKAAESAPLTEAERKEARDARYAKRKARK